MYSVCPFNFLNGQVKAFVVVSPDGEIVGMPYQDEQVARAKVDALNNKPEGQSLARAGEHRLLSTRG